MSSAPDQRSDETGAPSLGELLEGIGLRVRLLRVTQNLTLQELALRSGISPSMLSTVERGQASPSLATLHALAEGLNVRFASLFGNEDDLSPVTRLDDQIVEVLATGVERRLAVGHIENSVELWVDDYPPASTHALVPSRHRGYEYGVLIEGSLSVSLDDDEYHLEAGDSIHYQAGRAHLIRNTGDVRARTVWINLHRI